MQGAFPVPRAGEGSVVTRTKKIVKGKGCLRGVVPPVLPLIVDVKEVDYPTWHLSVSSAFHWPNLTTPDHESGGEEYI